MSKPDKQLDEAADSWVECWENGNDTITQDWMYSGFIAGASYMQARILELLRSDKAIESEVAYHWLEGRLQKDSE